MRLDEGRKNMFLRLQPYIPWLTGLLVGFVFVGGDVLCKNLVVYKGGELDREDKNSLIATPSAVHLPVFLSCTYCYSSPQSFLQILSASPLQYFSNYFSKYLEYCCFFPKGIIQNFILEFLLTSLLEEVVFCLCQIVKLCIHIILNDVSLSSFYILFIFSLIIKYNHSINRLDLLSTNIVFFP